MDIFTNTVGQSPDVMAGFLKWLLTAVVVLFGAFVIKGTYQRVIDDDMQWSDVIVDVCWVFAVIVWIAILID